MFLTSVLKLEMPEVCFYASSKPNFEGLQEIL